MASTTKALERSASHKEDFRTARERLPAGLQHEGLVFSPMRPGAQNGEAGAEDEHNESGSYRNGEHDRRLQGRSGDSTSIPYFSASRHPASVR